ncbi:Hypothetical predicted protein [Paramuricea clavata]|uniref:DUF7869 domain-containing protein n=1 Tax=Paramuricea clavata TaxID=317549 RepID=A0A7D9L4P5_PARCT|nr:Hypothetical predicted protein [Paramuricea clavata]
MFSLECLKSISYKDVEATQSKYLSLSSEVDKRNFILTCLRDHTSCQRKGPGIVGEKTNFLVKGKSVCQKAWLIVHGINPKRFGRIVKGFETGSEFYQHGNKLKLRTAVKTADCSAWISFLVNAIADQQPDTGKIHLPSCFTKLSLYRKMCEELNNSENVVSKSQFYSIMAKQFAQVVIPKIKENFLPVGHTHEDIDALFGLFSKHLRLQDVYTFDVLCESFEDCTTKPRPRSTKPQKMFDVREWLNAHSHNIHQHVKPHCFKFVRNEKGEAVMFYRKWSGENWMGPVRILKGCPEDAPGLLPPDYTKADIPKLREDLRKWESVMTASSKAWWREFLGCIEIENETTTEDTCCILDLKQNLKRPAATQSEETPPRVNMQFREKELAPLDEKKMPVIGKVVEVLEEEFTIHYWKGSYAKPWEPHLLKNGKEITPWSDVLPKQSIIICDFHLDSENKLLENTRKYLKRWYQEERART